MFFSFKKVYLFLMQYVPHLLKVQVIEKKIRKKYQCDWVGSCKKQQKKMNVRKKTTLETILKHLNINQGKNHPSNQHGPMIEFTLPTPYWHLQKIIGQKSDNTCFTNNEVSHL